MTTETRDPLGGGGDSLGAPNSRSRKARIPPHLVHDNEEITLELLHARAEKEQRRRFVEGLRRLRGHDPSDDFSTAIP